MTEYSGKTAYVTGSASGIGRGLALAFARRGAALALVDVSAAGLEEVAEAARQAGSPRVTTHVCDVTSIEQVSAVADAVLAAHGEVHFLCANAGIGLAGIPFTKVTPREVRWVVDVNTIGVYETVRSILPSMLAHGKPGQILCTASLAGLVTPAGWHHSLYSATKFGVTALAQGMRDEIGDAPIRVSTIYPGLVQTNISSTFATLRPSGGVAPALPEGLDLTAGISPHDAAEIILTAAAAGVEDICTHPAEAKAMHKQYSDRILAGVEDSAATIARLIDAGDISARTVI
jgi:NAD(P)-dependent dehydrogenase (short-subunit alcohol dehydrogenase family)